jgi:protease I
MKMLIMSADGFEDSELLCPLYRLQEAGIQVDIATPNRGTIQGKHGYVVTSDLILENVKPEEYAAVVIPGGKGPEQVRLNAAALAVVKHFMQKRKPIAAICHGPQVLISAGLLEGKNVTCWQGIRDDLIAAGAQYSDKEVVVDGNLITSREPSDIPAFCRELMKLLAR